LEYYVEYSLAQKTLQLSAPPKGLQNSSIFPDIKARTVVIVKERTKEMIKFQCR
jgi:hypothetical protein